MSRWLRVLLGLTLVACSAGRAEPRELTIFAATSLREPFERVARALEQKSPGLLVRLSFAGSQELRIQLQQGARADLFASADLEHMAALERAGRVAAPRIFARNELVVIVPRGPSSLASFAELPAARRLVIGAPQVPIGAYTLKVLENADAELGADFKERVLARVASKELNVRQVLAKVSLGEGDAGVVYRTDALAGKDRVRTIEIPPALNVVAAYPIALVTGGGPRTGDAQAFVELLLSPEGQEQLAAAGFAPAATGR